MACKALWAPDQSLDGRRPKAQAPHTCMSGGRGAILQAN